MSTRDWVLPCLVPVFGIAVILAECFAPKLTEVCTHNEKIIEIVRQEHKMTYVRLSNGKVVSYYSPTITPGDNICLESEWHWTKH